VAIPDGTFAMDPLGSGSGGKNDAEKLRLGFRALEMQMEKVCAGDQSRSSEVFKTSDSQFASEIAKVLLPSEYEASRDAARRKVEEAIRLAKVAPKNAANQLLADSAMEDLVTMVLGGAFPLGTKCPDLFETLRNTPYEALLDAPLDPTKQSA
jgi:hypothetical protein